MTLFACGGHEYPRTESRAKLPREPGILALGTDEEPVAGTEREPYYSTQARAHTHTRLVAGGIFLDFSLGL